MNFKSLRNGIAKGAAIAALPLMAFTAAADAGTPERNNARGTNIGVKCDRGYEHLCNGLSGNVRAVLRTLATAERNRTSGSPRRSGPNNSTYERTLERALERYLGGRANVYVTENVGAHYCAPSRIGQATMRFTSTGQGSSYFNNLSVKIQDANGNESQRGNVTFRQGDRSNCLTFR